MSEAPRPYGEQRRRILDVLSDDDARLILADAIAAGYSVEGSWDDILIAARDDLEDTSDE